MLYLRVAEFEVTDYDAQAGLGVDFGTLAQLQAGFRAGEIEAATAEGNI
jgi:hypothetical protein